MTTEFSGRRSKRDNRKYIYIYIYLLLLFFFIFFHEIDYAFVKFYMLYRERKKNKKRLLTGFGDFRITFLFRNS